jgi:hypothetical protein
MKLNSKLTGGLAWAGLVVVLAVPSADMLTGNSGDAAANLTSDMDAIRTATVVAPEPKPVTSRPAAAAETTVAAAGGSDPVVDAYINSGKKLPSYISDAPAEVASGKPATTTKLVVPGAQPAPATDDMEVASIPTIEPATVAPVPYPASMRPAAPSTAIPTELAAVEEPNQPLIIDEDLVQRREEAVARVLDDDRPANRRIIEGDELEEWDSGSLADYLERRGLISGDRDEASAGEFDDDGFFLDEGPNNSNGRRVVRRVRPNEFFFF